MTYITTATTYTVASQANAIAVQINKALTGTLTLATASGGTFAVVAATTAVNTLYYYGLRGLGAVTAVNASTEDVTISVINRGT